jgi:hypothetical protein
VLFTILSLQTAEIFADAENEAKNDWTAMSDHLDPSSLDIFIKKFPDSEYAKMAFAMRYSLLSNNPGIDDYNTFLKKYPDRIQSQIALQEVFELYRSQNRAGGYLAFLNLYPKSEQALVAKLRLQTLMFEFVRLTDKTKEYDAFIETFPDAPQISLAAELATKKAIEDETKLSKGLPNDDARDRQANGLFVDWGREARKLNQLPQDKSANNIVFRLNRLDEVITIVYKNSPAAANLVAANQRQVIIAKLDTINDTLKKNNQELIATLRQESKRVCDELKKGFALLHKDNQKLQGLIEKKFDEVEKGLSRLHDDLVTIHKDLIELNANVKETNRKLDKLDQDLRDVYTELKSIHKDMNAGFSQVNQNLTVMTKEMRTGFQTLHQTQLQTLNATIALRQDINTQFDVMNQTMNVGFQRVSQSIWASSEQVMQSNQQLVSRAKHPGNSMLGQMLSSTVDWVPFAGPLLSNALGRLGDVVQDTAIWAGQEAVLAGVNKLAPEYHDQATAILNGDWEQRKNAVIDTVQKIAKTNKVGIPQEFVGIVKQSISGDDLHNAVVDVAAALDMPAEAIEFAAYNL